QQAEQQITATEQPAFSLFFPSPNSPRPRFSAENEPRWSAIFRGNSQTSAQAKGVARLHLSSGVGSAPHKEQMRDEIRHFLRAAIAASVGTRQRADIVPRCARPARTGGQPRLRLRLGSRAPFPRGIFAL